ncbi:MAG: FAD-dependent oxidoreductase [Verrucomicrobia bacterium]|nr:FAD-dependent oxidoreductase [Verrucomicrobiota bacterium]
MSAGFTITIDGRPVEVRHGESVLAAARNLSIDIPTLCFLEKCGPLNSCQVCLVKLNGKLVPSCGTKVAQGMVIESETEEVHEARRTALELLFSDHVGDCLSPCHRLCPLMLNIPSMLRHIHEERLDEAITTVRQTLPLAGVLGRLCHHPCEQGCRRGNWDSPAAIRDMERFVTDEDLKRAEPSIPAKKPDTGKSVVIIGAGPTGLAAAFYLSREGHKVVVVDRRKLAGGTLRELPEEQLPATVLDAEVSLLQKLGVEFKQEVTLGIEVRLEGLTRGFDAILVAIGELAKDEAAALGLPLAGNSIKTDPNTCQTPMAHVFAAGSVVRPQKQLVKAMAEGRAAAECVHRFVSGQPTRRPEKPFSSIMGRLDPGELRQFLRNASSVGSVSPCDRCAGHTRHEAAAESSRCLHCDCHSSGNCVLQHYAQVYGADASRFRSERREFEQQLQPGGIIFEPGKCILCGICVKLTEMAAEPLGLAFVGRGFDVRVSAPFNNEVEAGLQRVGAECVKHCPTGALVFAEKKHHILSPSTSSAETEAGGVQH